MCKEPEHRMKTCEDNYQRKYGSWVDKSSVIYHKCPQCNVQIEKDGGCPLMDCQMCKFQFCWVCRFSVDSYFHYFLSLYCQLFNEAFHFNGYKLLLLVPWCVFLLFAPLFVIVVGLGYAMVGFVVIPLLPIMACQEESPLKNYNPLLCMVGVFAYFFLPMVIFPAIAAWTIFSVLYYTSLTVYLLVTLFNWTMISRVGLGKVEYVNNNTKILKA